MSAHVEHEAELAIIIGQTARFVSAADAFDYILGYT
jgi:2-keto-4-pentenoate hydratase/2-oxohepta-3-ene-1,7-dioic acid hydratase in catechol pathway